LRVGKRVILEVTLCQTAPGAEGCQADVRPQHLMKKHVYWMVVITIKNDKVLAMALVTVAKTLAVRLEYMLPEEGQYELELWVDCDSYVGLKQCINLGKIVVRS
jgi:hypothetical protein